MLLLDECIPDEVVHALNILRVPSRDIRGLGLRGAEDADLARRAKAMDAIFVTYDLDFTTQPALLAAMAAEGVCVVMLRRSKVKGPSRDHDAQESMMLILRHFREEWPRLCTGGAAIISCNVRGSRARKLSEHPWFKDARPVDPA